MDWLTAPLLIHLLFSAAMLGIMWQVVRSQASQNAEEIKRIWKHIDDSEKKQDGTLSEIKAELRALNKHIIEMRALEQARKELQENRE